MKNELPTDAPQSELSNASPASGRRPGDLPFCVAVALLLVGFLLIGHSLIDSPRENTSVALSQQDLPLNAAQPAEPLIDLDPKRAQRGPILASSRAPLPGVSSAANVTLASAPATAQSSATSSYSPKNDEAIRDELFNRPSYRIYVVRPEDTITGIAHRQLRSTGRWREIARLNADILPDPNRLRPGMRLRLPMGSRNSSGHLLPRRHTLQPGETLGALAERYYGDATLWEMILEANRERIHDEKRLQIGMVLIIPKR